MKRIVGLIGGSLLLMSCYESAAIVKPPVRPMPIIEVDSLSVPAPKISPIPISMSVIYTGTAPIVGNSGTCDAPYYQTALADSDTLVIYWTTGKLGGQVQVAAGTRFAISVPLPFDSVRVWAELRGLAGCDTTVGR